MNRDNDALRFRRCLCGCEKPIPLTSRRKYYKPACRKRASRDRGAKGIPPKKTGKKAPKKPKDPNQVEIDEIHEAWIRSMVEKGEMTGCDNCGSIYLALVVVGAVYLAIERALLLDMSEFLPVLAVFVAVEIIALYFMNRWDATTAKMGYNAIKIGAFHQLEENIRLGRVTAEGIGERLNMIRAMRSHAW